MVGSGKKEVNSERIKEGSVITSLNPALAPNYIEVYGRSMKKHTYNQQRVVSERKLTTENVAITKVTWT